MSNKEIKMCLNLHCLNAKPFLCLVDMRFTMIYSLFFGVQLGCHYYLSCIEIKKLLGTSCRIFGNVFNIKIA